MEVLTHVLLFLFSSSVIWFFAGTLIDAVSRVAKRFHKSGFSVAFFVLGLLTSISEISVAVNSSLRGTPQVSAGNLIGASFVILLLIIPLLAIAGNGISLSKTLTNRNLVFTLLVILLPCAFVLDGAFSVREGIVALLVYGTLLFAVRKQDSIVEVVLEVEEEVLQKRHATLIDALKILIGAGCIFAAGHFLVDEAVFFAKYWNVPESLIGLIMLSVGTNVPEVVIAFRSVMKKHKDIAFGDYLGSAATNTVVFAILGIAHGTFTVESGEFVETFVLMIVGFTLFYVFSRTHQRLSRYEGGVLLGAYIIFLGIQMYNLIRFSSM